MNFSTNSLGELKKLSLHDKNFVQGILSTSPNIGCESNFATLFMWSEAYGTCIAPWRDGKNAVLYNPRLGVLHFPLGEFPSPKELRALIDEFDAASLLKYRFFYDVPPAYLEKFPDFTEEFLSACDSSESDYIYEVRRLISMEGRKLRKKRNLIKQFDSEYPNCRVEEISPENFGEVSEFMLHSRDFLHPPDETAALESAFKNFDALSLRGVVLRDNSTILASAILNQISSEVWSVAFEKSEHSAKGAAQKIVLEEALLIKQLGASLMNREQDLGLENLRRAKDSLDPAFKYERRRMCPIRKVLGASSAEVGDCGCTQKLKWESSSQDSASIQKVL